MRKNGGKVYVKQDMKIEEVRKAEKFILLEARFSIIKRMFGNVSNIYREKLRVVRRFLASILFHSLSLHAKAK
jgi:hypothetical protein